MNIKRLGFLTPALLCAAGCATNSRVAVLEKVDPAPALVSQGSSDGSLQVYSARERVPIDLNAEDFVWNNDFGKNEFLHQATHTGYALYSPDGRLLTHVQNKTGLSGDAPAVLNLSPGVYKIQAEAENYYDVTMTVLVPVSIEAGSMTTVHLDGNWNTPAAMKNSKDVARLPNGNIVGWHFQNANYAITPAEATD